MDSETRKKYILQQLDAHEKVSLTTLAKKFNVSEMTIRRDFNELETRGMLVRKYGGAIKTEAIENLFSFNKRMETNGPQKKAICEAALPYIEDGDIIFIDCGTTLFRLAALVKNKRIRVITNSLPVISELMHSPTIKLTIIGGDIDADRQASYGAVTERVIKEFAADKAFVGADGVSLGRGLSSFDEKEAMVTKTMMEQSREVYLLCDSSKIERDSYFRLAPITAVDYLITDAFQDIEIAKAYQEKGLKIIIGQP
jgi:DeoR family fructose operon transcriptional repressor